MILIDVLQSVPGYDSRPFPLRIPLSSENDSAPGYIKFGNIIRWTATIDDPNEGRITLVTVTHDEAFDPEEKDVSVTNHKNYIVTTDSKTIVKEIISEMNNYHN